MTFGSCVWVATSIVAALLRERPVRLQRPPIDPGNPAQVLRCEKDLRALVEDLHRKVFAVQTAELERKTEMRRVWDRFVDRWRDRWTEVGRRCRLADTGGSAALDRLADAHAQIDELATAYGGLLDSFENRYVDRLRAIRAALDDARRAAKAPPQAQGAQP